MKKKIRVLFVIRATENYFGFRSIVESFYARGHFVKILFDKDCSRRSLEYLSDIGCDGFVYGWAAHSSSKFRNILLYSRFLLSLRRYYKVTGQSNFYKKRWSKALPSRLTNILQFSLFRALLTCDFAAVIYKYLEKVFPLDELIVKELHEFSPDLVLATPANLETSCDIDYLKTAQALKIPTATPVMSWDNLTTKGLIHIKPDLLLVWNEAQVKEAKEHHGISRDNIRITGSPAFDAWFSKWKLSRSKEDFCKQFSLPRDCELILYLGSSLAISGDERWLVKKLSRVVEKIGRSWGKNLQIVVRPHPDNSNHFDNFSARNVKVVPSGGAYPDKPGIRQLYYETIYFSTLCMGINTSGLIDSVILGKPTVSILVDRYRLTQIETQHFRHLVESDSIYLIRKLEEIEEILEDIWNGLDEPKKQREVFVKNYIRPRGLGISAGEIIVKEVEKLAKQRLNLNGEKRLSN